MAEEDLAKRRRFEPGPVHPESVHSDLKHAQAHHRLLKRLPKMGDD